MTETQLKRRVERWQKRLGPTLGIGHWRIRELSLVEECPAGADASATVDTSQFYDDVWFNFKIAFVEKATEQRLDEVIIHEWLHVAFDQLDDVHNLVEKWMPEATHEQFDSMLNLEVERLIERLARTIYKLYVVRS